MWIDNGVLVMTERDLLNDCMIAASQAGGRLFRNNVGTGWAGRLVSSRSGTVVLERARPLHAGLCTGSSDLIGWFPVVVSDEMVGMRVAVFAAVEAKTGRVRVTPEQETFLANVTNAGGIGMLARDSGPVMDAAKDAAGWLRRMKND